MLIWLLGVSSVGETDNYGLTQAMSIAAVLGKKNSYCYYLGNRETMSTVAILDYFMSVDGIGRYIFF